MKRNINVCSKFKPQFLSFNNHIIDRHNSKNCENCVYFSSKNCHVDVNKEHLRNFELI